MTSAGSLTTIAQQTLLDVFQDAKMRPSTVLALHCTLLAPATFKGVPLV
jgi:hypothetical protein